MPLKNHSSSNGTTRKMRSPATVRKKRGVVDAVIIHEQPNLAMFLSLQNLMNYFVDSINSYTLLIEKKALHAEHLSRCIASIRTFSNNYDSFFTNDIQKMLSEFLDDADDFKQMTEALSATHTELRSIRKSTFSQLVSKAAHLQWLSVCIIQEIKQVFVHA